MGATRPPVAVLVVWTPGQGPLATELPDDHSRRVVALQRLASVVPAGRWRVYPQGRTVRSEFDWDD